MRHKRTASGRICFGAPKATGGRGGTRLRSRILGCADYVAYRRELLLLRGYWLASFVIRVAGRHLWTICHRGSIEYAVEHPGDEIWFLFLGHEKCGAIFGCG